MTDPLARDQRVIADISIDGGRGNMRIDTMVLVRQAPEDGDTISHVLDYPFDDDVVERLARAAHHYYWDKHVERPVPSPSDEAIERWAGVVEAIFAELMGE